MDIAVGNHFGAVADHAQHHQIAKLNDTPTLGNMKNSGQEFEVAALAVDVVRDPSPVAVAAMAMWMRPMPTSSYSALALFLLWAIAHPAHPDAGLNTGSILSTTYAGVASCSNIRLIGLCFWLVCDGFWCDIEVPPKWGSYHPDAVVPAYAQTALTPWVEMRPVMAAFAAAASSAAGAIGGSWSLGGGEQVDRARDQEGARMLFREADVIGHPLGPLPVIFGISCPAPIVPFMPYFVSSIDGLGWRLPELEWLLYPSSLIPGLREIGHWPMNTWGPVHPRTGYLLTPDPAKAGAVAAQRAGDLPTAIQALEAVHGKTSGAESGQIAEQLAAAYAQQRNNAKASEWLNKAVAAGNNSPTLKQLQSYLQSASGDFNAIAKDSGAAVAAAEAAGRRPDEGDLLRLADAQQRLNNLNGYAATLEKLLLNYPKKDYWNAYLGRLPRKNGFADRFLLDVLRLRLASGTLTKTEDFMELAQLAMQQGLPSEARRVAEQGFKAGLLGTGPEAQRHQRLRALAVKEEGEAKAKLVGMAAEAETFKEGDGLVKVGVSYVSLGEVEQGLALIQKGIAKGNLKRPEDAKLRLGLAQLHSPKTKAAGVQTLRAVKSTDGAADIARLWLLVPNGGA